MHSDAGTVDQYLNGLSEDRRNAISAVRDVILTNLPEGIEETMRWGMISYEVPLSTYPDTYNGQPLSFAGLASQKNHMAVYLSGIYADSQLRTQFEDHYAHSGKKLDAGKSCIRFKTLEGLDLDAVAMAISWFTLDNFCDLVSNVHKRRKN